MATAAYPGAHTTTTEAANFIPELWADEVIASYKANLVLAQLVTMFNHQGKKGDVFHLPAPTRADANAKVQGSPVTVINNTEPEVTVTIDQHFEYSRLIEDLTGKQALDTMRMFYTDDAGYSLARQIDTRLHQQLETLQGGPALGTGTYTSAVIGSNGSTAFNGSNEAALTDAGIRTAIQLLDDLDVPQSRRALIIPPVEKNNLLGLNRFTEQAFVGEVGGANSIRNGRIGNVYGVEVFVSTNCATVGSARIAALVHVSAMALVMQQQIRVQTQYKQEHLADLLTADTIFGTGELRNDAGVAIAVAA